MVIIHHLLTRANRLHNHQSRGIATKHIYLTSITCTLEVLPSTLSLLVGEQPEPTTTIQS